MWKASLAKNIQEKVLTNIYLGGILVGDEVPLIRYALLRNVINLEPGSVPGSHMVVAHGDTANGAAPPLHVHFGPGTRDKHQVCTNTTEGGYGCM